MSRYSRRALLVTGGLGGLTAVASACSRTNHPHEAAVPPSPTDSAPDVSERFAAFQPSEEPNGDLSRVVWPAFILREPPEVRALYEFQILNGDLMRYMPCFCGCQWEDDHRNNRDCYIDRVNPDGSVVFDSMAPT